MIQNGEHVSGNADTVFFRVIIRYTYIHLLQSVASKSHPLPNVRKG
jgi:hypothetical protein